MTSQMAFLTEEGHAPRNRIFKQITKNICLTDILLVSKGEVIWSTSDVLWSIEYPDLTTFRSSIFIDFFFFLGGGVWRHGIPIGILFQKVPYPVQIGSSCLWSYLWRFDFWSRLAGHTFHHDPKEKPRMLKKIKNYILSYVLKEWHI